MDIQLPRPLSELERALVARLLAFVAPDADELTSQIPFLQVVGVCGCGCATVNFQAEAEAIAADDAGADSRVVSEALGTTPSGIGIGLLLWARDDRLSGLEVYACGGAMDELPLVDTLVPIPPEPVP
jgi:hypothetical protein